MQASKLSSSSTRGEVRSLLARRRGTGVRCVRCSYVLVLELLSLLALLVQKKVHILTPEELREMSVCASTSILKQLI